MSAERCSHAPWCILGNHRGKCACGECGGCLRFKASTARTKCRKDELACELRKQGEADGTYIRRWGPDSASSPHAAGSAAARASGSGTPTARLRSSGGGAAPRPGSPAGGAALDSAAMQQPLDSGRQPASAAARSGSAGTPASPATGVQGCRRAPWCSLPSRHNSECACEQCDGCQRFAQSGGTNRYGRYACTVRLEAQLAGSYVKRPSGADKPGRSRGRAAAGLTSAAPPPAVANRSARGNGPQAVPSAARARLFADAIPGQRPALPLPAAAGGRGRGRPVNKRAKMLKLLAANRAAVAKRRNGKSSSGAAAAAARRAHAGSAASPGSSDGGSSGSDSGSGGDGDRAAASSGEAAAPSGSAGAYSLSSSSVLSSSLSSSSSSSDSSGGEAPGPSASAAGRKPAQLAATGTSGAAPAARADASAPAGGGARMATAPAAGAPAQQGSADAQQRSAGLLPANACSRLLASVADGAGAASDSARAAATPAAGAPAQQGIKDAKRWRASHGIANARSRLLAHVSDSAEAAPSGEQAAGCAAPGTQPAAPAAAGSLAERQAAERPAAPSLPSPSLSSDAPDNAAAASKSKPHPPWCRLPADHRSECACNECERCKAFQRSGLKYRGYGHKCSERAADERAGTYVKRWGGPLINSRPAASAVQLAGNVADRVASGELRRKAASNVARNEAARGRGRGHGRGRGANSSRGRAPAAPAGLPGPPRDSSSESDFEEDSGDNGSDGGSSGSSLGEDDVPGPFAAAMSAGPAGQQPGGSGSGRSNDGGAAALAPAGPATECEAGQGAASNAGAAAGAGVDVDAGTSRPAGPADGDAVAPAGAELPFVENMRPEGCVDRLPRLQPGELRVLGMTLHPKVAAMYLQRAAEWAALPQKQRRKQEVALSSKPEVRRRDQQWLLDIGTSWKALKAQLVAWLGLDGSPRALPEHLPTRYMQVRCMRWGVLPPVGFRCVGIFLDLFFLYCFTGSVERVPSLRVCRLRSELSAQAHSRFK